MVRAIGGVGCVLGLGAFLARMVMKVRDGRGLDPYTSLAGYPAYPLGVLIFAAMVLTVAGLGLVLGWWRPKGAEHRRRR